ncbi:hypothetical protein LTR15_008031 [Elasticomyces elasticus]|nr:hypothetical protein LTR15_008031 [Elasticomyces elasticus]
MATTDPAAVASGSVSSYVYGPLEPGSIRLIKILSAHSEDANICCQTACFRRDEELDYTALSYAWGPKAEPSLIILDGQDFYVRQNLLDFLRTACKLRGQSYFSRWFWIDALSINQSDGVERNHQVASMSAIYSNAKDVLIWLGPRSQNSDIVMQILRRPLGYWRDSREFYDMWTSVDSSAVERLVERSYWSRLWIFQEIAFARHRTLMCGDWCVAWESFADFLDLLERKSTSDSGARSLPSDSPAGTKKRSHIMRSCRAVRGSLALRVVKRASQTVQAIPLWDPMFALEHLQCSDPRDKVYALVGVAAQHKTSIEPDYTVPILTVAHAVLRYQHQIKPPTGIDEVDRQCTKLEHLLGLHSWAMLETVAQKDSYRNGEFGWNVYWAAFYSHSAVANLLAKHTGRRDTSKTHIDSWLADAVNHGHEETVARLLALEFINIDHHPQTKVRYAETAPQIYLLDIALRRGHVAIARMLLETGHFDINASLSQVPLNLRHINPLHLAVQQRDVAMVEMLLSNQSIDVNQRRKGNTPLENAVKLANVKSGPRDQALSIVGKLLASGKAQVPRKLLHICIDLKMLKTDASRIQGCAECVNLARPTQAQWQEWTVAW